MADKVLYQLIYQDYNQIVPIQFSFNKEELEEVCDYLNNLDFRTGSYTVKEVSDNHSDSTLWIWR